MRMPPTAAVLLGLLGAAVPPPAHAGPGDLPAGRKCGFNSTTDVAREAGWQVGDINGGPLVTLADGVLRCRIIVNGGPHSSPYAAEATATAVRGVAVLEPRQLSYRATAADTIDICTSWVPAVGPTLYWVQPARTPEESGYWTTDANAPCSIAINLEPYDPECRYWHFVDNRLGTNIAEIWQDCERYGEFDPYRDIAGVDVVAITGAANHAVPASDWQCTEVASTATAYEVSCQPLGGGSFACTAPHVVVAQAGTAATGTAVGTVRCGTSTATCAPNLTAEPVAWCVRHALTTGLVTSFGCRVEFPGPPPAGDWTVACRPSRAPTYR